MLDAELHRLIFSPVQFGSLSLRNRIVMAPMTRRFAASDGMVTDEIIEYYRRRAAAGVGLIVSEGTAIDCRHAYDTLTVPRIETQEQIAGWRRVVEAVRASGGAFAPQLWHTGRLAYYPIGPSACEMPPRKDGTARPPVKAMDAGDFAQVTAAYVHAARASREIGSDALEIHGAHGYLLDSFVSPVNNRRTDQYGGDFDKRMRFPLEVVRAVRTAVGPAFPVIYRFSQWKVDDPDEIKFRTPEELERWVTALREAGVDILHVSTKSAVAPAFPEHGGLTLAGWSRKFSGLPTIAVGSVSMRTTPAGSPDEVTDPAPALRLVERGEADLIAVGRALISNANWVELVREDRWRELSPYAVADLKSLV
ncbi:MAG TPA: 12-oxophytodienoate reductase [candidate division Zixibacteria bacterium]|nr:12-oxophytodienoate reductase [candidate division Zixibacteria bacterium]